MSESGVDWQDTDQGWESAVDALRELAGYVITIGVHGSKGGGEPHKGTALTQAQLAAVHEFGATIEHPGGTPYKIVKGKAVFLAKESASGPGVMYTKPHKIRIPQRSFLRATVDEGTAAIDKLINDEITAMVEGKRRASQSAERIGLVIMGMVQKRISDGIDPPNKAETIRRKGSDKPLVRYGELKSSITYVVRIGRLVVGGSDAA